MKSYSIPRLIVRACAQELRTAKGWAALHYVIAALHALSLTAAVIVTQRLFDNIVNPGASGLEVRQVAFPLLLLAAIVVLQSVFAGAESYLFQYVSYGNSGKFMVEFQRKLGRLPAENFENPEFLDELEMARECLEYESLGIFTQVVLHLISFYTVFFVSLGIFLFRLSPMLPLVIIIAFVPAVLGLLAEITLFAELEEENAPLRRRFESYQGAIVGRQFFKETRLLGGFRYFHNLFSETLRLMRENTWRTERKAFALQLALNLISFIGLAAAVLLLFRSTMAGSISVGAFAAVFAGLTQIFSLMNEVVSEQLGEASEYIGPIEHYYRLMDMPEVGGSYATPDFRKGVSAQSVSFTYPGRTEPAVENVTLNIAEAETIAIVGENGAGKSTLVRLLIGLYLPNVGKVEIGGLDSQTTHPKALYQNTSGVFQNYQRYKMTLAENVNISNPDEPSNNTNIHNALTEAQFSEPKATLETMLSPEFGGIDLSGGQWQRLAIARGLYRTNQFIVLDEPTAAIDPIEESRIYNQFEELAKGKCAIIVTHRLGSAKLADRIVVMNKGQIVDIGTHNELLSRGGKYHDMWESQKTWYENR